MDSKGFDLDTPPPFWSENLILQGQFVTFLRTTNRISGSNGRKKNIVMRYCTPSKIRLFGALFEELHFV